MQAAPDRVAVIFSAVFREETDRIFGEAFLQVRAPSVLCCAGTGILDEFGAVGAEWTCARLFLVGV